MKRIIAIVRTEKLEPLKEALFNANVSGMTITQVMGCGNQHGWSEYYRGTEVLLNMVPKVRFELVVNDDRTQEIVDLHLRDGTYRRGRRRQGLRERRRGGRAHPHRRTRDIRNLGPAIGYERARPPSGGRTLLHA